MYIRRIAVGVDYKSGAMHYIQGQSVIDGNHTIHLIHHNVDTGSYQIYVENDNSEILLWKEFTSTMPITIEYNLDF